MPVRGENEIRCVQCGTQIGTRDGREWTLTAYAHPCGGPDFRCVNCRNTKRETKTEGKDENH